MERIYKKSQGMPINVIIIAALSLVVLFVLIIIFTNQTGKTVSSLESCAGIGGRCAKLNENCLVDSEIEKSDAKCPQDSDNIKQKCCIKVFADKK